MATLMAQVPGSLTVTELYGVRFELMPASFPLLPVCAVYMAEAQRVYEQTLRIRQVRPPQSLPLSRGPLPLLSRRRLSAGPGSLDANGMSAL